jgi:four helix bundle protein
MEQNKEKTNLIQERSYLFGLKVIRLYHTLSKQGEFILSKQLVRSGTSIGANVEEAMAAQSRKDFISKMSIASKEARKTNYWIRLLQDSGVYREIDFSGLLDESGRLIKILTSIVKTSRTKPNL